MRYRHYTIVKHGVLHWLSDNDLDYMANEEGWLLISKIKHQDSSDMEYTFRKEEIEDEVS